MRKQLVNIVSRILPNKMANLAYKILTNPQVKKLRPHELEMLDKADKSIIKYGLFDIQTYKWGKETDEKILLIHGWEGQAGNFADIIKVLLKNNYYVIAFDGPSHGFSSQGATSPFDFGDLVVKMIRKYKCKKLMSHSFGGVATTYALYANQDIVIDKYVLLTTPDKFSQRINDIVNYVGTTEKVKNILINRIEKERSIDTKEFNVSNFVKHIKVKDALIIHDKNDKVIPISQSRNVSKNWINGELQEIEGTGHFRILRTEEVINDVISFLNQKKSVANLS